MIPEAIKHGIESYKVYGERFLVGDFLRCGDIESVDRYLVSINHPLAYSPGSREYRFVSIVKELVKEARP